MLKPIDTAHLTEWSWEGEKAEPKSVFLLRPLTKRQRAKVTNETLLPARREYYGPDGRIERVEVQARTGTAAMRYTKMGLAGVKDSSFPGWADEAATPDLCTANRVPTDAFLDTLPDQVIDSMSLRIQELSTVSESDAGKSSPPST